MLWFASAAVQTPDAFQIDVVRAKGPLGRPLGGNPVGAIHLGEGQSPQLQELGAALRRQSRWSAGAAVCAAISALCQALLNAIR